MSGGAADVLPEHPGLPQLPPATPKNPPPSIASLLLFCFPGYGSNQYSIRTAGDKTYFRLRNGVERANSVQS